MSVYIAVGKHIVGVFADSRAALKIVRRIAPGCKPEIKKCRHTGGTNVAAKYCSNETRQFVKCTTYKRYPRMLKAGEFTL